MSDDTFDTCGGRCMACLGVAGDCACVRGMSTAAIPLSPNRAAFDTAWDAAMQQLSNDKTPPIRVTPEIRERAETALHEYAMTDGIRRATDEVSQPAHYTYGDMEVKDVIEAFGLAEGFYAGNIIKYVLRYQRKAGIKDIRKAMNYCLFLIEYLEKKERGAVDTVLENNLAALLAEKEMPV